MPVLLQQLGGWHDGSVIFRPPYLLYQFFMPSILPHGFGCSESDHHLHSYHMCLSVWQPPAERTASHKHVPHLSLAQFAALKSAEKKVFCRVLIQCILLMVVNYLDR